MDKKWLPLTVVLGAAAVAVVTASAWPEEGEEPLPQSLCHGALSRGTAELIDDGKGARSARTSGRPGGAPLTTRCSEGAACCVPTRTATTTLAGSPN